jgi:predicted nucleic acid-binding Zn finger protein
MGSRKTLSYMITLPFSNGKIIIIVSALNVLGEQFVAETVKAGYPVIFVTVGNDNDTIFLVH